MEKIKDGGPAFPTTQYVSGINPTGHSVGMTLRDYFAAKAMQGMLANHWTRNYADWAEHAYMMADEMLRERGRR